jgi:hypothetical protein
LAGKKTASKNLWPKTGQSQQKLVRSPNKNFSWIGPFLVQNFFGLGKRLRMRIFGLKLIIPAEILVRSPNKNFS